LSTEVFSERAWAELGGAVSRTSWNRSPSMVARNCWATLLVDPFFTSATLAVSTWPAPVEQPASAIVVTRPTEPCIHLRLTGISPFRREFMIIGRW
jgi:hypothetical protein